MTDCDGDEVVAILTIEAEKELLTLIGYLLAHSTQKGRVGLWRLTELGLNPEFVRQITEEGVTEFERRTREHPNS